MSASVRSTLGLEGNFKLAEEMAAGGTDPGEDRHIGANPGLPERLSGFGLIGSAL
ncbi:hypothetical protein [Rhizobium mongolense]|uniref:hypothetical protein n=1 Tax=Rhizobium mongolense TaxID=57676 RepID=UPI001428D1F1|nr:hypothetical protein [Rhizobium mongolense]